MAFLFESPSFGNLFNSISDPLFIVDGSRQMLFFNDPAKALFQKLEINITDINSADYQNIIGKELLHDIEQVFISQKELTIVKEISLHDVTIRPEIHYIPIMNDNTAPRVVVIFRCAGSGKKEHEKNQTYIDMCLDSMLDSQDNYFIRWDEKSGVEQKHFLEEVIESISIPFYIINLNSYKVILANQAARNFGKSNSLYCYEMSHNLNKPCQFGNQDHPCPLVHIKQTKTPITVEHIHYDKNNNKRYVEVHAYPIFNEKGEVLNVVETSIDITYRKNASLKLEELAKKLKQSNDNLRYFVYAASHDLKEPLRMISSYVKLIQKYISENRDDRNSLLEFISFAQDGADRLDHLICDLLVYSRLDTEKLEFEVVDLNQALQAAIKNLDVIIKENQVAVIREHLPSISAINSQIIQLFQNLLSNAIKYRKKEYNPVINIKYEHKGENHLIHFNDNGIGINKKNFNRIFEMFQRLHPRQAYEGSGVGLSVCKKIMGNHSGDISVQSIPDQGSTFTIRFPENPTDDFDLIN